MDQIKEHDRKVAEATKVLLDLPEMNMDRNDPESLLFHGEDSEDEIDNPKINIEL